MTLIIFVAGCVSSPKDAGATIGVLNAGLHLPTYPDECRRDVPHASLALDGDSVVTLRAERGQVNEANRLRRLCGPVWWDKFVANYKKDARKASAPASHTTFSSQSTY